jgi:hypothetical protein
MEKEIIFLGVETLYGVCPGQFLIFLKQRRETGESDID